MLDQFAQWFYANVWGNIVASAITASLAFFWAKRKFHHLHREHVETRNAIKQETQRMHDSLREAMSERDAGEH